MNVIRQPGPRKPKRLFHRSYPEVHGCSCFTRSGMTLETFDTISWVNMIFLSSRNDFFCGDAVGFNYRRHVFEEASFSYKKRRALKKIFLKKKRNNGRETSSRGAFTPLSPGSTTDQKTPENMDHGIEAYQYIRNLIIKTSICCRTLSSNTNLTG